MPIAHTETEDFFSLNKLLGAKGSSFLAFLLLSHFLPFCSTFSVSKHHLRMKTQGMVG